ncbi:hypothetical protein QCA50_005166 [Cerrena zonata]|uniref:Alpha/beta hydrolase fold-3 domain-containing protein n=1 Tax=Cerrena zonata TaxID=2478898 RepID=A0AAW0GRB5_9APHY
MIAAYLYLIRPPAGSSHRPVKPAHIVVAGDSAGGGLCIALLQVLRDTGLPMPAGGVLISPWCDLTHSFPSIHLNTATDVIPPYGLSLYKPSTLWPPPPDEITVTVQESVRSRIRQAVHLTTKGRTKSTQPSVQPLDVALPGRLDGLLSPSHDVQVPETGQTLHLGSSASLPIPDSSVRSQSVSCQTADGSTLTIDDQVHLYAPNYLLQHPLVSPVVSYLGGLPPLLVIASDKEVLRDEIVYFAHKAAHPEKYPVKNETRAMYPSLIGIEKKYGPTPVHLQVYDDTAHILPVLFSFTTPAKYCYRAIASFIKLVTGIVPPTIPEDSSLESILIVESPPGTPLYATSSSGSPSGAPPLPRMHSTPSFPNDSQRQRSRTEGSRRTSDEEKTSRMSLRRALSASITKASAALSSPKTSSFPFRAVPPSPGFQSHDNSVDVGGPRFQDSIDSETGKAGVRTAGEDIVYAHGLKTMIRERVSTRGVIRPLEPEHELSAFSLPDELVGVVSELALRRYLDGKTKFDKKFHSTTQTIAKRRLRHFETARRDATRKMNQLQTYFEDGQLRQGSDDKAKDLKENLLEIGSWNWAWALEADEHPPPSSIVSRRDTAEAVELARIADQSVLSDEHMFSGNNLWSMVVNFLTVVPDGKHHHHQHIPHEGGKQVEPYVPKRERFRSIFAHFSKQQQKVSHSSPVLSSESPEKVVPTNSSP